MIKQSYAVKPILLALITISIYDTPDPAFVVIEGCTAGREPCVQVRTSVDSLRSDATVSAIAEFIRKRLN